MRVIWTVNASPPGGPGADYILARQPLKYYQSARAFRAPPPSIAAMSGLSARYTYASTSTSPSEAVTFPRQPLGGTNASSALQPTEHLHALHLEIDNVQNQVNAFLTERMEADRQAGTGSAPSSEEVLAEENYGEEVADG